MHPKEGQLTVIVGGQYGDEGKGSTSAHLARLNNTNLVVRAGVGPNAEHGIFVPQRDELKYLKANQLPLGFILNESTQIRIGPGVAIDPKKLYAEMDRYDLQNRVRVSPASPIVEQKHILFEEQNSRLRDSIGSTLSGSGPARADHIMRRGRIARDVPELQPLLVDVPLEIDNCLRRGGDVILECSQGYGLRLSNHHEYPNVTSDDVTSSAALADAGISPFLVDNVVMVVKSTPTREGGGSMGSSNELSLDEIQDRSYHEPSSIGGKQRRVATQIDWDQLQEASRVNGATQIALTFCERHDPDIEGATHVDQITPKTKMLIKDIERNTGAPVTFLNTGKRFDNIIYVADPGINLAEGCKDINFPDSWFDS